MGLSTKQKGSIAELAIAADLAKQGYKVAVPFGEYGDWDLLVEAVPNKFERVQVKYATSDGISIKVRGRCHSVTAGRVSKTKTYDSTMIDWIAVYDTTTDLCYYLKVTQLQAGGETSLRLLPVANGKSANEYRWAYDYEKLVPQCTGAHTSLSRSKSEFNSRRDRMKVHGHRDMLNLPGHGSTAAIVAEIQDTGDWKPGCTKDGDAFTKKTSGWQIAPDVNLTISDCSRSISFDTIYDGSDVVDWENFLHKVDTMVDALTTLRAGVVTEQERYRKRKEIIDNMPEKEKDDKDAD